MIFRQNLLLVFATSLIFVINYLPTILMLEFKLSCVSTVTMAVDFPYLLAREIDFSDSIVVSCNFISIKPF